MPIASQLRSVRWEVTRAIVGTGRRRGLGETRHRPRSWGMRIRPDETSGVLHPENLTRYAARWIDPDPAVRDVVDTYWHVRWHLDEGEVVDQTIVDLPAVTLTVEAGDVPADLVVTGLHRRAWQRRIAGSGDVFAIRLRPPGSRCSARYDRRTSPTRRSRSRAASTTGSARSSPASRPRAHPTTAPARPTRWSRTASGRTRRRRRTCWPTGSSTSCAHAPTAGPAPRSRSTSRSASARSSGRCRRRSASDPSRRPGASGCRRPHGRSRCTATTTSRRSPSSSGYADQAHLTSDFRAATGTTPGAYRRQLRQLAGQRQSGNAL